MLTGVSISLILENIIQYWIKHGVFRVIIIFYFISMLLAAILSRMDYNRLYKIDVKNCNEGHYCPELVVLLYIFVTLCPALNIILCVGFVYQKLVRYSDKVIVRKGGL